MKVIGICGSTGSGKSTVCQILSRRGFQVLDCDEIYHNLVENPTDCLNEIGNEFGKELIAGGKLDRKKLGKIVFSDSEKLTKLNKISHFYVLKEIKKLLETFRKNGEKCCLIDAPMLFEAGLDKWCDFVCAVVSNSSLQIERVCKRDHISTEEAKKRLCNQISEKSLREKSDFVIENSGDYDFIEKQCDVLLQKISLLKG